MNLTAVLAHRDRATNLEYCLASIANCTPRPYVVLVDFGSCTPLPPYQQYSDWLEVISVTQGTELFHKSRAVNIGVRNVKTEYLCITDVDQVFSPNFFGEVYRLVSSANNPIVFSRTYFLVDQQASDSAVPKSETFSARTFGVTPDNIGEEYPRLLAIARNCRRKRQGYPGYGRCQAVATSWVLSVHGYDEEYIGWGAEDRDFELRARFAGLQATWLSEATSMVHLPHPKAGVYYSNDFRQKNMERWKRKLRIVTKVGKADSIIANKNSPWGCL